MNILKKLRSNEFALIVAILSVLVQSFHSYTAFYNTSSLKGTPWGIVQAVLFALVFDMAILFYTVRNKKDVVLGASVFMIIINVYYYYQGLGLTFEFMFGCLLSMIIPVTQYYYSEEIRHEEEVDNPYHYARIIEDKDEEIDALSDQITALKLSEKEYDEHLGRRLQELETIEKANRKLAFENDQLIGMRDQAINSNSVLSEALGMREREIFELKKRLGDLPEDAVLDLSAAAKKVEDEIQDRSLLYVDDSKSGAYNPTTSNKPVV